MTTDQVLAGCAVATVLGTIFAVANRLNLAPFKILIKSNTDAMESLHTLVDKHTERLDNHGERIAKIEVRHSLHHPGEI
jgi:hypothetical protein